MRHFVIRAAATALTLATLAVPALAGPAKNLVDGVALHGFDPVAYFVDHKPTKGDPSIASTYDGATYEFASKEHKALFDAAPAKYVPVYGGYCAFAVTEGIKADIDPYAYAINDGKLYVNFSVEARDAFQANVADNGHKAEANWPKVQKLDKVYR